MAMGDTPNFKERDSVALGICMRHHMSPEGKAEQANKEMLADMFVAGLDPNIFI